MHADMIITAPWRKATASNPNGACVELAGADWRTSSYTSNQPTCVEVASGVLVRDTTFADHGEESPVLAFSPDTWTRFLTQVKAS